MLLLYILIKEKKMKNKILYNTLRILTGLVFVVFGAMKFLTQSTTFPGKAGAFFAGMLASGYFIPLLAISEVVVGLMLLFNFLPSLAAVMLVPISLNIFFLDIILRPAGWIVGIFPLLFNAYLIYFNFEKYKPMLKK